MHVGNIMSTMGGGVQYCGGKYLLLFEYLLGTEHPHATHDIPTCIMISPHGTQFKKDGIPPLY